MEINAPGKLVFPYSFKKFPLLPQGSLVGVRKGRIVYVAPYQAAEKEGKEWVLRKVDENGKVGDPVNIFEGAAKYEKGDSGIRSTLDKGRPFSQFEVIEGMQDPQPDFVVSLGTQIRGVGNTLVLNTVKRNASRMVPVYARPGLDTDGAGAGDAGEGQQPSAETVGTGTSLPEGEAKNSLALKNNANIELKVSNVADAAKVSQMDLDATLEVFKRKDEEWQLQALEKWNQSLLHKQTEQPSAEGRGTGTSLPEGEARISLAQGDNANKEQEGGGATDAVNSTSMDEVEPFEFFKGSKGQQPSVDATDEKSKGNKYKFRRIESEANTKKLSAGTGQAGKGKKRTVDDEERPAGKEASADASTDTSEPSVSLAQGDNANTEQAGSDAADAANPTPAKVAPSDKTKKKTKGKGKKKLGKDKKLSAKEGTNADASTDRSESSRLQKVGAGEGTVEGQRESENQQRVTDERVADQTKMQVDESAAAAASGTNRLAAGVLDGATTSHHAQTGSTSDGNLSHVVDESTASATKPGVEADNNIVRREDAKVTDVDDGDVLMGSEGSGDTRNALDSAGSRIDSGETSANRMAADEAAIGRPAPVASMDVDDPNAIRQAEAEEGMRQFQQAIAGTRPPRQRQEDDNNRNDAVMVPRSVTAAARNDEAAQAIAAQVADLARVKEVYLGGRTEAETEERVRQKALALVRAKLLVETKGVDVQRMTAPTPGETLSEMARAQVQDAVQKGGAGYMPIFTPAESIASLRQFQSSEEVMQMTLEEKNRILTMLKPWWNEFRQTRTNQAVMEMQTMPTYVIKSATSSVQLASKVREDMKDTESNFFLFMFWALRAKMAGGDGEVPWVQFFKFAAAMGYNDLTQAQINWLVTGNPDGEFGLDDITDYREGLQFTDEAIRERSRTRGLTRLSFKDQVQIDIASAALVHTVEPKTPPPNRNVSPSAGPTSAAKRYRIVDGKLREVVSDTPSLEEAARATIAGIPSSVSNIPDPRFSERGGQMVENVRIVTRRNPKYRPDVPKGPDNREFIHVAGDGANAPSPPSTEPEFIEQKIPDVGAGAGAVQAEVQKAEADRLLASLPFKMYAPIHPQACDRYLGVKNYARLSLEPEQYFADYSQHPWGAKDVQQQYDWNAMIMTLYGPMLYAFVTDANMQRTSPVFGMETPQAVTLEYMELNELVVELKAYQMKSADRANRVGDSGAAQTPIEQHLDNFFKDRDRSEQEAMSDANAVIISLPDVPDFPPRPGGGGGDDPDIPPAPPNPVPDPTPGPPPAFALEANRSNMVVLPQNSGVMERKNLLGVSPVDIERGIRRDNANERNLAFNKEARVYSATNDPRNNHMDLDRRSRMYKLMHRR